MRRLDNSNSVSISLAVYRKTAGAGEAASYSWSFSASTGTAGGIMTLSGADPTTPINMENGQTTASGLAHSTPDVTTTVANTMLVTAHTFSSSATWTPPAGMTEVIDVSSLAPGQSLGLSLEMNYAAKATAGATGAKTATASGDDDGGNAEILAIRRAP